MPEYGEPQGGGSPTWDNLDRRLKVPLMQLIAASGGKVWVNEGHRDTESQAAGFYDRHVEDPNGSIEFDGKRWRLKPGMAPMAPPGRSMHEIGLAADMGGDMEWLQQNAARFGLKTFASVNNEPWHVQLVDLPDSRAEYDRQYGNYQSDEPGGGYQPTGTLPSWPGEAGSGPVNLPADAQLYSTGTSIVAVFDVGGAKIGYNVNLGSGTVNVDRSKIKFIGQSGFTQLGVHMAGNVEELRGMPYGTYKEFFDAITGAKFGPGNPARNDPEVLQVLLKFADNPLMSEAEFQGLLRNTSWWNSRTQGEIAWNDLSEAERQAIRNGTAAQMAQQWFSFTGENIGPGDARILNYVEDIASGKTMIGSWTETVVKPRALLNPESPWSRTVRGEGETQRQRGIDIENTVTRVKELANKWGVRWSEGTYQDWARKIVTAEASDEDVLNTLKGQAKILYPWKDPEMETSMAASPWLETYRRVLEKEGDMFTPQIQAALTAGAPVWEFEQQLKKSADWLDTKNGRDDMFSTMSEINRLMGYS